MRKAILFLSATALALAPAAAQQARYLNPRDVAEAQREHAEIVQELGGAETGSRAAYVQSVGRRVGAYSGVANPGQALNFTTINSAVENAFSVPGGYIYVTRQLMTLMEDESQLAFALGHEVAHIAAEHARARQRYAQRSSIFGVLGQVLGAVLGNNIFGSMISQSAQQAAQLRTLSFSRDQEYHADTLGLRYIIAAGYDPAGAAGILAALSRASALEQRIQGRGNRETPEWARTHPLEQNRMVRALQAGKATGRLGTGVRNRDGFLAQLEGVYVDDDPAQGVIEGPTFTHPDLRIQFSVPPGFRMSNGTRAVTVSGSTGKAQFRQSPSANLDESIIFAFRQLTEGKLRLDIPPPQRTMINGMPVAITTARVPTSSGVIDASVAAFQWSPNRVYYFVMLSRGGYGVQPFIPMINSLRRISAQEAAVIRPRVIDVVTVRPGETIHSLASRMAYRDFQVERFMALNGLAANSRLAPGQKVKLVVYGARRG